MKIKVGTVCKVKHRRKGNFVIVVRFTDNNFTTGMIVKGKAKVLSGESEFLIGDDVTVRNSFCKFERVEISEAKKS